MSADIDAHVTKQYDINKRIGKGVSVSHDQQVEMLHYLPPEFYPTSGKLYLIKVLQ